MHSSQTIVEKVIELLHFNDATIEFEETEEEISVNITIPQEESGILIGYKGEKINALQRILSLMLNQDTIAYKPVNIDINQYRHARTQELHDMADKAAIKAIESGREILLPPLSARERRIIHMFLSKRGDITTYSEGEGSSRRLVVRPEGESQSEAE